MKPFLIFSGMLMVCLSCTKDKHPDVLTLKQLIEKGDIVVVEKRDSTLSHTISFINDSIYLSKKQHFIYLSDKSSHDNVKKEADYDIKNSIELKNMINGKTYLTDTIDSGSSVLIDNKGDLLINNTVFASPGYSTIKSADSSKVKDYKDIETSAKALTILDEFDESIIYKWTNTGKLGNLHDLFYFQINGTKFKSTTECYLIRNKYFYNSKYGVLKFK